MQSSQEKTNEKEQEEPMLQVCRVAAQAMLPKRASAGAAGYDLSAAEHKVIAPRSHGLVTTGLQIRIPAGCYGRVAPRSGLALKSGIDVGAGVIDSDYRGTIGVILFNHSNDVFSISPGDRIAQLILTPIKTPPVQELPSLLANETERGSRGFGSTGIQSIDTNTK